MKFIFDVSKKSYTFSAIVVGYLLINELNDKEQNDLGNWLMLIGQLLSTNASYEVLENDKSNITKEETINIIEKTIKVMKQELEDIKNSR